MTLRRRYFFVKWCTWLASVLLVLGLAPASGRAPLCFVPLVVLAVWFVQRRANVWLVRPAYRRLQRLMDAGAFDAARALLAELEELYAGSRNALEQIRMNQGTLLSLEGRHADAAALYRSIDRRRLAPSWQPLLLNNLAWSLLESGDAAGAVTTARESMAASEQAGDRPAGVVDLRACQLGTLGSALVGAGQPDEGVPLLEQALARGGQPRQQAARAFYLGEGLRALGKYEDASLAYRRAVEATPDGDFGRRAKASLERFQAYRA